MITIIRNKFSTVLCQHRISNLYQENDQFLHGSRPIVSVVKSSTGPAWTTHDAGEIRDHGKISLHVLLLVFHQLNPKNVQSTWGKTNTNLYSPLIRSSGLDLELSKSQKRQRRADRGSHFSYSVLQSCTQTLTSPIADTARIFSKFAPVIDHAWLVTVMQNVGMLAIVFIQGALGLSLVTSVGCVRIYWLRCTVPMYT